jgi:hypothetical protein
MNAVGAHDSVSKEVRPVYRRRSGCALRFLRLNSRSALPDPRVQPTDRTCPDLRASAALLWTLRNVGFVRRGHDRPRLMRKS